MPVKGASKSVMESSSSLTQSNLSSAAKFIRTFYYFFPFLSPPIVQKCTTSNKSAVAYISESNMFGADFIASGVTEDDSLNILYEEMTSYLFEFSKAFLFTPPSVLDSPKSQYPFSPNTPDVNVSPKSAATSSISIRLENCMKNTNINACVKQQNPISQLYEYVQKNGISSPNIEYFVNNSLFGCKVILNNVTYFIDASYKKKSDAKEAACKHILTALGIS